MERIGGSYRDPSGFMFKRDGVALRQVNEAYAEQYALLMSSGLYDTLTGAGMLTPHEELDAEKAAAAPGAYKVLRPEQIPFISYPYEWCFSQLRDAALLTLDIQEQALERGMCLKDATVYNVQFVGARPVFIDTLSFEALHEERPWIAYRQFCRHFLAPLALARYGGHEFLRAQRAYPEGAPLQLAAGLLPLKARLSPSLLMHIIFHAKAEARSVAKQTERGEGGPGKFTLFKHRAMVDSLRGAVKKLNPPASKTVWSGYYQETNYTDEAFAHKSELVREMLAKLNPEVLVDLGANTGEFSKLAPAGTHVLSIDGDPQAVELMYADLAGKGANAGRLTPLVMDACNPSAGIGWMNQERDSFLDRGPYHTLMALALVHHLAIGANVPLNMVAKFLRALTGNLIIEFVPKEDGQVQRMLQGREDIFPTYTQAGFEAAFETYFTIRKKTPIKDSKRSMYLMQAKA